MKLAPRTVFTVQILSLVVCGMVQAATKEWVVSHIPDLCSPDEPSRFTCPTVNVFYTASVLWGVIGARRTFGKGTLYNPIYYGTIVGVALPLLLWYLSLRLPRSRIRYLSAPLIFAGMTFTPPASGELPL